MAHRRAHAPDPSVRVALEPAPRPLARSDRSFPPPPSHRSGPGQRSGGATTRSPRRPDLDARRVNGLAGLAVLVLVATGVGLPLPGGHLAVDALLVVIGFRLGLGMVRMSTARRNWLQRFWLTALGPIVAPTLLAVALVTTYTWWLGQLDEAEVRAVVGTVAMVPNLFQIFAGVGFPAIDHLWLVGLIVQFTLLLPLAVGAMRRHGAPTVGLSLVALAVAVAVLRSGFVLTGQAAPHSIAISTLTRTDGLLLGAAVAFTPRSVLYRVPASFTTPAIGVLAVVLALGPNPIARPGLALGLLVPIAVVATAAAVVAGLTGGQGGLLAPVLDSIGLRWLGERALGIYIWHELLGVALDAGTLGAGPGDGWPGASIFVVRLVFALAAGAASYRYLQLPVRAVADRLTSGSRRAGPIATTAGPSLRTT